MRKWLDRSLGFFIIIGLLNTVLSALIMQGLSALWGGGYWAPSAIAFALTSVLSFFLNKRFSFENQDSYAHTAWRFALVIGVCYFLAYLIARPATAWALHALLPDMGMNVDRIAMYVGQVLFTGLNYIGQRFFAFRKGK